MVTTFTYTYQFGEDRCMQFRVIMVTDPQTNKHTSREGQLQYTVQLSAQCNYSYFSLRNYVFGVCMDVVDIFLLQFNT